ncbi:MAG: hypothetical protein LQ340_000708 [Diploschistes diacapsis]|nr:MAG: hypothetical protein LQ340_000708 [Diploschistes diacapsis]
MLLAGILILLLHPLTTVAAPLAIENLRQLEARSSKPTWSVVPVDGGAGASASSAFSAHVTVVKTVATTISPNPATVTITDVPVTTRVIEPFGLTDYRFRHFYSAGTILSFAKLNNIQRKLNFVAVSHFTLLKLVLSDQYGELGYNDVIFAYWYYKSILVNFLQYRVELSDDLGCTLDNSTGAYTGLHTGPHSPLCAEL